MSKTTIIMIVIGLVLVVVLVFVLMPGPTDVDDLSKIQEILNDPKSAAKNCTATCRQLTKRYSILARLKPRRQCESDCANGKDITKIKY